jgi:RNA polymerase sigma-70 factor (ECF subfamily)
MKPRFHKLETLREELQAVHAAQRGDPVAFQRLYERYRNYVYSLCLRMTRDSSMAEDLTQDIFFHVWRKMASFKGQALFRTWLYRVTINRVLLHLRKHRVGTLPLDAETLPVAERALLKNSAQTDQDDCISLRDTVASLSPHYRRVLMLHDLEGYRHSDISRLLGITSGASRSQLRKARTKLRLALGASHAHSRQKHLRALSLA